REQQRQEVLVVGAERPCKRKVVAPPRRAQPTKQRAQAVEKVLVERIWAPNRRAHTVGHDRPSLGAGIEQPAIASSSSHPVLWREFEPVHRPRRAQEVFGELTAKADPYAETLFTAAEMGDRGHCQFRVSIWRPGGRPRATAVPRPRRGADLHTAVFRGRRAVL